MGKRGSGWTRPKRSAEVVDDVMKGKIEALSDEGYSTREIGTKLGKHQKTIFNVLRQKTTPREPPKRNAEAESRRKAMSERVVRLCKQRIKIRGGKKRFNSCY